MLILLPHQQIDGQHTQMALTASTLMLQLVRPEQGMRCVLESVHHDYSRGCRIINAWHAEGAQWVLTGEDEPKVRP